MFKRLTEEEIKKLRAEYHKVPAFIVTYRAIDWMSTEYSDIEPVEAWSEAIEVMKTIAAEDYKRFSIESACRDLPRKYEAFQDITGQIHTRSRECAERTALMVLFDAVFMLIMRQKDVEDHPYKEYCQYIVNEIVSYPHYEDMCKMVRTNEENLEEDTGHELEPQDFLNTEGVPRTITGGDITKENLERAIAITMQCESYFRKGLGYEYVKALWEDLLAEKYLHLAELLNGQSFNTLVCGVIGIVKDELCTSCTYMDLAKEMTIKGMERESIANYMGKKCSGSAALKKVASFLAERGQKIIK